MTTTTITERHRHRLDPDRHPERVAWRDLAARLGKQVAHLFSDLVHPPVDHPTVVLDALSVPDMALARQKLEASNSAWLAPERRAHCGGQVHVMGQWYRCPEPGSWGVTGMTSRFCAVHAATQVDLLARTRENAAAAKAAQE